MILYGVRILVHVGSTCSARLCQQVQSLSVKHREGESQRMMKTILSRSNVNQIWSFGHRNRRTRTLQTRQRIRRYDQSGNPDMLDILFLLTFCRQQGCRHLTSCPLASICDDERTSTDAGTQRYLDVPKLAPKHPDSSRGVATAGREVPCVLDLSARPPGQDIMFRHSLEFVDDLV